jgi:Tc toxin complex TcA C-terminal TcB-binding domain
MTTFSTSTDQATVSNAGPREAGNYDYGLVNFFHPLIGPLIQQLNQATGDPLAALLDPGFLAGLSSDFFTTDYTPSTDPLVRVHAGRKMIDLDRSLPYANYNWELIYHIPVAIAVHLSQNGRFAEAQKWFHYVFDPTSKDMSVDPPARYWKCLYFRDNPVTASLVDQLTLLSTPDSELSSLAPNPLIPDPARAKSDILTAYRASCTAAFEPFAVARARPSSFQWYVVMKYLDNLIAWGDSLFAQMTIETVNEATLCYALAANLLGPPPQEVPPVGTTAARSYNDLQKSPGFDAMGNALVALESQLPFNIIIPVGGHSYTHLSAPPAFGIGRTLYFCIPVNPRLLAYWDIVNDRLTKIRSCENLQGQFQPMPLFDPPIDPGLLVAATAAGLDLGSAVSGLNQPVGPYKAQVMIQKAAELASEVRSLGASLLSAIEKGEAEHLAQLRQTNEVTLQQGIKNIRFLQWQQAQAATEALLRTRATALERYTYYLRLLNQVPDDAQVPASFTVDHSAELTEDNFGDAYQALVEEYDRAVTTLAYPQIQQPGASSPTAQSGVSGTGHLYLNANEDAELNLHLPNARDLRTSSSVFETFASTLVYVPDFTVNLQYLGLGTSPVVFSGTKLAAGFKTVADILRIAASWEQDQAAMAGRSGGYQRRADEWLLQANLAARELSQIGRQLLTSIITEQAAYREYTNAQAQADQSQEVLDYLRTKFSSEDLYTWMSSQLSSLLYAYYRLALDTARRAEQTLKAELRRPELDAVGYIQPNYWDGGRKGLLAGEPLSLDIKRMDTDYHAYNVRDLELTKHVSLRQLSPVALLQLKMTGSCSVSVPEWLYDRDCPGHYMRRLDMVSVSVPCTVGSNTSVNLTMTLQHSSIRTSSLAGRDYKQGAPGTDNRFTDYYGSIQSIVTSGAVADSGMFDPAARDDRFRPFEGAGAVSTWTLALPVIPSFDYASITDVILHVRYTARDGGAALAAPATKAVTATLSDAQARPLSMLLSLRHDFPTEWYAFASGQAAKFTTVLPRSYFPYVTQGATLDNFQLTLYSGSPDQATGQPAQVTQQPSVGMKNDLNNAGQTTLEFAADPKVLKPDAADVFLIVRYTASGISIKS